MDPVILGKKALTTGYVRVDRLKVRLPSGVEIEREVQDHGHSVAVLPYDRARGQALIVSQFRAPVLLAAGVSGLDEACAGMVDEGEDLDVAARREAREELGVQLSNLELVATVWPSPGVCTERATLYLAPYTPADRTGPGGGLASENENITVIERSLVQLALDADAGRIVDAKLLTLVLALRLRHASLFEARV